MNIAFESSFAMGGAEESSASAYASDHSASLLSYDTNFNSLLSSSDITLQSLIALHPDLSIASSPLFVYNPTLPPSFNFFDPFNHNHHLHLAQHSSNAVPQLNPFTFTTSSTETCLIPQDSAQLFRFLSTNLPQCPPPLDSPSPKRHRVDSLLTTPNPIESLHQTLEIESVFHDINAPNSTSISPPPNPSPDAPSPRDFPFSELARKRRQKLSDKTRYLQKLMPWETKMDMATMLGETCKYVEFLQAQVKALQSMPMESSFSTSNGGAGSSSFGMLGKLSRQQLLQVLLNSPVAQTWLYSQGRCVFSVEQMVLVNKLGGEKGKAAFQDMMFERTGSSCGDSP